jgi:mannose-6-phosphate isomerase
VTLTRLVPRAVGKVWGRRDLRPPFEPVGEGDVPIGEIWFEHPDGHRPDLAVKYLFTAETSSIQVHPAARTAPATGPLPGKDEAWILLDAEPGSVIGRGLRGTVTPAGLRAAALDGSIADLVHWHAAAAGEVYYSPAGTLHALGPGLVLLEIQQNSDITYRLYDYGRPRPLHVEEGVAACDPLGTVIREGPRAGCEGRETLSVRGVFVLEQWRGIGSARVEPRDVGPVWLIPLEGRARVGGHMLEPGSVWMLDGSAPFSQEAGARLIAAYSGASACPGLLDWKEPPRKGRPQRIPNGDRHPCDALFGWRARGRRA